MVCPAYSLYHSTKCHTNWLPIARFRVKKKQREAGLEAQITELTNKLERLEKELEAARVENGFLRDLVIRKVGGDSSARIDPSPVKEVVASTHSSGIKMSGGQTGNTGMGTEVRYNLVQASALADYDLTLLSGILMQIELKLTRVLSHLCIASVSSRNPC